MGYYINPEDRSKEQWLAENGTPISAPVFTEDTMPVCLVDNGPFTAAAICYNEREVQAFSQPNDFRPRQWFSVPKDKLIAVCPSLERVG